MNRSKLFILSTLFILGVGSAAGIIADDGKKRGHHGKEDMRPSNPANTQAYADTCGGCHFAYQPWLLPANSWEKILAGLQDHYGNAIPVTEDTQNALRRFLVENAAGNVSNKRSEKILRSINGQTPLRISEVPYILHKHRKIDKEVFQRPSVGSLGNCPACHPTASQGVYEDDNVRIPR